VPLGLVEGSTENTTTVTELLVGLRDRGLDVTRPVLVVIDGAKALSAAVRAVFDHPVIQRCQLHKIRNLTDRLPDHVASTMAKRMRAAYHATPPWTFPPPATVLCRSQVVRPPGARRVHPSVRGGWPRGRIAQAAVRGERAWPAPVTVARDAATVYR